MISKPHTISVRLSDRELEIYEKLLKRVASLFPESKTSSEKFRKALALMDYHLKEEAMLRFYDSVR